MLIADDEEIFLNSTADLLRREGFYCDCVQDANAGIIKLKSNQYDVLITDIRMPGNPNLEFIKALPRLAEGLSAILVTGYPSQNTAIDAIGLPVIAYLIKPVDFTQLLEYVLKAIDQTRFYRTVSNAKKTLETWRTGLASIEDGFKNSGAAKIDSSQKNFLDLTFAGVNAALADIRYILSDAPKQQSDAPVCHLFKCPRLSTLKAAVNETIDILEKTKSSFKSSELGKIRKKLEKISKNNLNN